MEVLAAVLIASVSLDTNIQMGPVSYPAGMGLLTLVRSAMEALDVAQIASAHLATNLAQEGSVQSLVETEFSTLEKNVTAARAAVRIASVHQTSNLAEMGPASLFVIAPSVYRIPVKTSAM